MRIILEERSHHFRHEESLVNQWLLVCEQKPEKASLSQLQRGRVDAKNADLVMGTIPFIKAALRQHGSSLPPDHSYPPVLDDLLRRVVKKMPLHQVMDEVDRGGRCFVKPAERQKLFTGFVIRAGDEYRVAHVPRREPVWRSDVVSWIGEWRFYVVCGQIRAVTFYQGDSSVMPNLGIVGEAVDRLAALDGFARNYAIDFGVLADGQTALVECNDGFAIGAYDGLPMDVYFEMLKGRWAELVSQSKEVADV